MARGRQARSGRPRVGRTAVPVPGGPNPPVRFPFSAPRASAGAALALGAVVTLAVPALLRSNPTNWTWGASIGRYVSPALPLSAALLSAVLAVLACTRPRAAAPAGPDPLRAGAASFLLTAGVSAALGLLFWHFAESIHFLGDTLLRVESIREAVAGGGSPTAAGLHAAPLDLLVNVRLPMALARSGLMNPLQSAALVPCLLGAAFVWAAAWAASGMAAGRLARGVALAVILSQGYMQLFAGYSEAYGFQIVVLTLWYGAAVREESRGEPAVLSSLFFGLALLCHRADLLLAPAQAWLVLGRGKGLRRAPGGNAVIVAAAAVALACAAGLAQGWMDLWGRDAALIGARSAEAGDYALLSRLHLANVTNALFLLCPVWPAGLLLAFFVRPSRKGWTALLLAGGAWMALALAVRSLYPIQGAMRDWDDFAGTGLFLGLGTAQLAAHAAQALQRRPGGRTRGWLAFALPAAALGMSAAWVLLNSAAGPALLRAETMVAALPAPPQSSRAMMWEYLGETRRMRREYPQSARAYSRAFELAPNPRLAMLAGKQMWRIGERRGAEQKFRSAVRGDSLFRSRVRADGESRLRADPADSMGAAMLRAALAVTADSN